MNSELRKQFVNDLTPIRKIVNDTRIVDYGIVDEVLDDDYVVVLVSVNTGVYKEFRIGCRLGFFTISGTSIHYEVEKGDRVLVFHPKDFVLKSMDLKESIYSEVICGYSANCGIAIPIGTFDEDNSKSTLKLTKDGEATFKNEKTEIKILKGGDVEIKTDGKYSIANSTQDLKSVLDSLIDNIVNMQTYGSPALHNVMPSSQTLLKTDKTNLDTLLK